MSEQQTTLTLIQPDDWHLHLRDGEVLPQTVAATAQQMGRAIVMPNLVPPVTNNAQALAYYERITQHRPKGSNFEPLMVLYLTDNTRAKDVIEAKQNGKVVAAKLYPAGATTNSDSGVTDILALDSVLEAMSEQNMPLLIHGEVTHAEIDIFDREAKFIETILAPLVKRHPNLKIVLEHITTEQAVDFVLAQGENIAATITVQHLMYNRNQMLVGGIKPHYYCLPILKRNRHQLALQKAAISGSPKFFLGTDSAPHATEAKESACGCAGCFSAYAAIELYAEIFDELGALDKLEGFASLFGPKFYGLKPNDKRITLIKKPWQAPASMPFGQQQITPLKAGETIQWQVA